MLVIGGLDMHAAIQDNEAADARIGERVMNADGSSQTNLTPAAPDADNFDEYQPARAPSGTQIVFLREVH